MSNRVARTFVSMILTGLMVGAETDAAQSLDDDHFVLLQNVKIGTSFLSSPEPLSPEIKRVVVTEVITQDFPGQAKKEAADRVKDALEGVDMAEVRAVKEAQHADEQTVKADAALNDAKQMQAKASEDLKAAQGLATKAVHTATGHAESNNATETALKEVTNVTHATVMKAQAAAATAKTAVDATEAAASEMLSAVSSVEEASQAKNAIDKLKMDVETARRAEEYTWAQDYVHDSSNPLEEYMYDIEDETPAVQSLANAFTGADATATTGADANATTGADATASSATNATKSPADVDATTSNTSSQVRQAYSDVVEKATITEKQAIKASNMATNTSKQAEALPSDAGEVSKAAIDVVDKASDAHDAAKEFSAVVRREASKATDEVDKTNGAHDDAHDGEGDQGDQDDQDDQDDQKEQEEEEQEEQEEPEAA